VLSINVYICSWSEGLNDAQYYHIISGNINYKHINNIRRNDYYIQATKQREKHPPLA